MQFPPCAFAPMSSGREAGWSKWHEVSSVNRVMMGLQKLSLPKPGELWSEQEERVFNLETVLFFPKDIENSSNKRQSTTFPNFCTVKYNSRSG